MLSGFEFNFIRSDYSAIVKFKLKPFRLFIFYIASCQATTEIKYLISMIFKVVL